MKRFLQPLTLVTRLNTVIPVNQKTAIEQGFHSKFGEVTVEGSLNEQPGFSN